MSEQRNQPAIIRAMSAAGLALTLAACSSSGQPPSTAEFEYPCRPTITQPGDGFVAGYLPTWGNDPEDFARAAALERLDRVIVAFAEPHPDGTVDINLDNTFLTAALRSLAQKGASIAVSVGGWGSDATHDDILAGFDKGLAEPDKFANEITQVAEEVGATAGVDQVGVDLDPEFLNERQARLVPALVNALHNNGIGDISMAVAANNNGDPVRRVANQLADLGVVFNVMTYDFNNLSSTKTGPVTSHNWMIDEIGRWVKATGVPRQVNFGIPTEGYNFIGASGPGQSFDRDASASYLNSRGTVGCEDVDDSTAQTDPTTGTTSAIVHGTSWNDGDYAKGWTSIVTHLDADAFKTSVEQAYPGTGAFAWKLTTATQHQIDSLS